MKVLYAAKIIDFAQLQQAQLLIKCFNAQQIDIDVMMSGDYLANPSGRVVISQIEACQNGKCFIKQSTARFNGTFRQKVSDVFAYRASLKIANYDLVIVDNESLLAWSAKLSGIPIMAIGHQVAINHNQLPFDGANLTRAWQQFLVPADYRIGFHWIPFAENIFPPIVPSYSTSCIDNKVVVYLPSESIEDIIKLLECFPNTEFYCFHPKANTQSIGNIHFRTDEHQGLLKDMESCKGVITHANFDVINTALKMGKSLLIKPLEDKISQTIDASLLIKLGWAKQMHYLNANAVEDFLDSKSQAVIRFSSDPCLLVKWIKSEKWDDMSTLHDLSWKELEVG